MTGVGKAIGFVGEGAIIGGAIGAGCIIAGKATKKYIIESLTLKNTNDEMIIRGFEKKHFFPQLEDQK